MEQNRNLDEVLDALYKKARGYTASETVEEYSCEDGGGMSVNKKKVSFKHVPPDISAAKLILDLRGGEDSFLRLTEEELENERRRLLRLLGEAEQN